MPTKWLRIMRSPIVLPDLGAGPVVLSIWLARPGDHVFEGDRLVEVLVQGATFRRFLARHRQVGGKVGVGR